MIIFAVLFEKKTEMKNQFQSLISCEKLRKKNLQNVLSKSFLFDGRLTLLILVGKCWLRINNVATKLQKNSLLFLSSMHKVETEFLSDDIEVYCLWVSSKFMEEHDSTRMMYFRVKYGVETFSLPNFDLDPTSFNRIVYRMNELARSIEETTHFYYFDVVINALYAFFLDTSNFVEQQKINENELFSLPHQEQIVQSFFELMAKHYRKEHFVSFYATQLNLTMRHLILLVRNKTGRTPTSFINEMLLSDARSLLLNSQFSIAEITFLLGFSDQSAFGKFFKRQTGFSPKQFKFV